MYGNIVPLKVIVTCWSVKVFWVVYFHSGLLLRSIRMNSDALVVSCLGWPSFFFNQVLWSRCSAWWSSRREECRQTDVSPERSMQSLSWSEKTSSSLSWWRLLCWLWATHTAPPRKLTVSSQLVWILLFSWHLVLMVTLLSHCCKPSLLWFTQPLWFDCG